MPQFLQDILARIEDAANTDWLPVSPAALLGVAAASLAVLFLANRGERWVPLLDHANLAFHEFGHPLFGLFSERLGVYGGTFGQLAFPLICAASFWLRREAVAFALSGLWTFENFFNIARYMADARRLELPLVGGCNPEDAHDWLEIFSRWGVLGSDTRIAGLVTFAAWIGILAILAWLARRCLRDRAEGRVRDD